MNDSIDDELGYFSDVRAREEELRRLNHELDLKLDTVEREGAKSRCLAKTASLPHTVSDEKVDGSSLGDNIPTPLSVPSNKKVHDVSWDDEIPILVKKSLGRASNDDSSSDDADGDIPVPVKNMGSSATIRLQRAKIKALTEQLKSEKGMRLDTERSLQELRSAVKKEISEKKKLQKALAEAKSLAGKSKAEDKSTKGQIDDLTRELSQVKRELSSAHKSLRTAESEHRGREVRLSRALEECNKLKITLAANSSRSKEVGAESRKERDQMVSRIKSLERQRAELLVAFKKQMKLIDILKRQKVHAEAAKLISFTEEEFVKVLEWGT